MTRCWVQVSVAPESLAQRMVQGEVTHVECYEGLPEGARLVGAAYDFTRRIFLLTFEHPSFEPVEEGDVIPDFAVWFRTISPCEAVV